ncbi:MAG: hypothetical protein JJU29_00190 [Verrucomicrobia bacterium]|nr:hypothetical protein [Verrucomicrobiota bacterium]MCH8511022.1 hypothetical protein [Kiritimatiellia bacterium]
MRFHSFILFACFCGLPFWGSAAPADVEARVRRAEADVRLAEATERRIADRLENLRADPETDPAAIQAMETYLREVGALKETHQKTLADLRAMTDEPEERVIRWEVSLDLPEDDDRDERQDELARLANEFQNSLDSFDQLLLDHFDKLRQAMDQRIATGGEAATSRAQAAADAAALLRDMGVDPGVGRETDAEAGEIPETASTNEQNREGVPSAENARGTARQGQAGDRPPRQDEDIVARQLREAAEKETDPELREKLWKEYEAYLDGRS